MYLYSISVNGFRRIVEAQIICGKTTFLVGANNSGKTTCLKAIEILLKSDASAKLSDLDFFTIFDEVGDVNNIIANEVSIVAEFRDVDDTFKTKSGFRGRLHSYNSDQEETGNSFIIRKKFKLNEKVKFEIYQQKRSIKEFINYQELFDVVQNEELFTELLGEKIDLKKTPTATNMKKFLELDEIYDYDEEYEWLPNPDGLMGVFNSNLPKYIEIPALHTLDHFDNSGTLAKIMNTIFDELKETSENYQKASEYLAKLSDEMNPEDDGKEFGKLIKEISSGFEGVFPGASLNVSVDLSDPKKAVKPTYDISAKSNIGTPMSRQGTGLSRSAVFNLLKFRAEWLERRAEKDGSKPRKILIGFEEPEIYLHPSSSRLIRDFIYKMADSESIQIICTTHSTHMIDLSNEKARQVINHCKLGRSKINDNEYNSVVANPFQHSKAYKELQADDKAHMKMLLSIDEKVSNIFFTENAIIFEGNTEEIALKESIERFPDDLKLMTRFNSTLINARGKATIISICKYLNALGIRYKVLHDSDEGNFGAEKFNSKIEEAAGQDKIIMADSCTEDALGYSAPKSEKPFTAYKFIQDSWPKDNLVGISDNWLKILKFIFRIDL